MSEREYQHLTNKEVGKALIFCARVLELFGLPDYVIKMAHDPSEDGTNASITPEHLLYTAVLYLSADWMSYSENVKMRTLIHEMIHILFVEQDALSKAALGSSLGRDLWNSYESVFHTVTERLTDRLENILWKLGNFTWPTDKDYKSNKQRIKDYSKTR